MYMSISSYLKNYISILTSLSFESESDKTSCRVQLHCECVRHNIQPSLTCDLCPIVYTAVTMPLHVQLLQLREQPERLP